MQIKQENCLHDFKQSNEYRYDPQTKHQQVKMICKVCGVTKWKNFENIQEGSIPDNANINNILND